MSTQLFYESDSRRLDDRNYGLAVQFNQKSTGLSWSNRGLTIDMKIPALGRQIQESVTDIPGRVSLKNGFCLLEGEDHLAGGIVLDATFPLERDVYDAYLSFLDITQNWHLYRIWHYVPFINRETQGIENYRSFCKGRSLAFEHFLGSNFSRKLPAASAVGINDTKLVMYFLAGKTPGMHIENPEQVSAYQYPRCYGPRPPSFARGTCVDVASKRVGYLSGTASIKGHQSVTLEDTADQLYTTLDNMSLIFESMGFVSERHSYGSFFPNGDDYERFFKVYIRHLEDTDYIQSLFSQMIGLREDDRVLYLQSDICRSELNIEIEAIISDRC
ncbi:chorismate transformation enzyme, FkbO/Hyg5 family [Halomicronema hongdechloris]|nr:hypothetical protein [Halomicronema hongdechloris]